MQRKRGELVPVAEAFSDLSGAGGGDPRCLTPLINPKNAPTVVGILLEVRVR